MRLLINAIRNFHPEHDLEIAALFLNCGAGLFDHPKYNNIPTHSYLAILHDNLRMIKLFKPYLCMQTSTDKILTKNQLLEFAKRHNAVKIIEYLENEW